MAPLLVFLYTFSCLSCKESIEPSIDGEIDRANTIIRVIMVDDGGELKAKKEEVIKAPGKLNYSGQYVPFPDITTRKAGDEWIVFYQLRNPEGGTSEYVSSAISLKNGQLKSRPEITIEELRRKVKDE